MILYTIKDPAAIIKSLPGVTRVEINRPYTNLWKVKLLIQKSKLNQAMQLINKSEIVKGIDRTVCRYEAACVAPAAG